ncbi:Aste57867_5080 [Aphanomyces stellatus]|uniref:Aste57867_5080 protein n=1 Tax=Aphanomyces stellatus TaxID=120398 RepID=A0A485KGD6_9STRA|nr:hypothetical protein As57867_005067 [Aphanomyces stellatus]VFT82161.1 Aste57867_5080 [Aphanomyces stellatus]
MKLAVSLCDPQRTIQKIAIGSFSLPTMEPKDDLNVFAVDLRRASQLARISYDELIAGIHTDEATPLQGVYVDDLDSSGHDGDDDKLDALVLTSTMTTAFGVPLCLQQLNGKSVVEHALSQLLLAGINRAVVAVSSSAIRTHVEKSVLFSRMTIVFLEVRPKVLDSMPETVLTARHFFTGSFLVLAPNRVVDKQLVEAFVSFHRQHQSVCMLIEPNPTIACRMDPATIRVQLDPDRPATLLQLGRDRPTFDGVDVGLFVVPDQVFGVLDRMSSTRPSTFSECLVAGFAPTSSIHAMATDHDQRWLGVDTTDQMVHVVETNAIASFAAYDFPVAAPTKVQPRRSLVLAMATNTVSQAVAAAAARARPPSATPSETTFEGFVVPVKDKPVDEAQPLLSVKVADCTLPSDVAPSSAVVVHHAHEYSLSIPVAATTMSTAAATSSTTAYLIQQHGDQPLVLAVPTDGSTVTTTMSTSFVRRISGLPSGVKQIALEARVADDMIDVQLSVHKSVPLLAYGILGLALVAVSSQGAAMQSLVGVPPLLKMAWRFFGASCLFAGLSIAAYWDTGRLPTLSPAIVRDAAVCIVSYAVYAGTFIWALDHTSVSHVYIFSNAHSLLIVLAKCVAGHHVAAMEASGALLGIVGGIITTADTSAAAVGDADGNVPPSVGGDIVALVGAVGAVFYLTCAKDLQGKVGVWNFCFGLFTGTWIVLAVTLVALQVDMVFFSVDPHRGFFGWVHHLGIEAVLVLVVTTMGTMGFVTSMKYFSSLVVSVTMLLEPVVATGICIVLGMAPIPGWLTFAGGVAVMGGTLLVIWSTGGEHTETTNVTEAVLQSTYGNTKGHPVDERVGSVQSPCLM